MTRQSSDTAMRRPKSLMGGMGYSPYPAYKDSGIEWLGEIPEHWEVKRLKLLVGNKTDKVNAVQNNSHIALEHVESWTGKVRLGEGKDIENEGKNFLEGDILFGKLRPYLAKILRASKRGTCSSEFLVLRSLSGEITTEFLEHKLRSKEMIGLVDSSTFGTKMPRAEWNFIGNVEIAFPPDRNEQRSIAAFLDFETTKIDTLVEKQEQLIDLLQERRVALISHAVTKGLDPNIPMKDSGIEWLGEIPEYWSIRRLGSSIDRCINGIWGGEPDGHNDLVCVRVADFDRTNMRVLLENRTFRSIAPNDRNNRLLNKGDLLLEKSGGGDLQPVGAVVLYEHDFAAVCSNFIGRMVVSVGFDSRYLTYLHSCIYAMRLNVRSIKQTTGIQNLDVDSYLAEHVAFPPLAEQTAITTFLDRETAKIDQLISKIHQVIKLQKEERSALISAVVTGKIDVRKVSISTA